MTNTFIYQSYINSNYPPPRQSSTLIRRLTNWSATLLALQPFDGDFFPEHPYKYAAALATTSGISHRTFDHNILQISYCKKQHIHYLISITRHFLF